MKGETMTTQRIDCEAVRTTDSVARDLRPRLYWLMGNLTTKFHVDGEDAKAFEAVGLAVEAANKALKNTEDAKAFEAAILAIEAAEKAIENARLTKHRIHENTVRSRQQN